MPGLTGHLKESKMKNKILAALIAILAFGQGAWAAENGWEITTSTSGSVTTFTITRTNTAVAETVKYRFVNLSAFAGQHYNVTKVNGANSNALTGEFTFAAGDATSRTIQVTEQGASTSAYNYQIGTSRSYKLELTDAGGFYLTKNQRSFTTGTSVTGSGVFDIKDVTIQSSEYTANDDGYDVNGYKSVSASSYCTTGTQAYLGFLNSQLRMTLSFDAKENDDAYEYLQLLVDNTSTCDNRSGVSNGNPGNISLSKYMAGFEMNKGAKDATYRSYTFPILDVANNGSATNPWGYGTDWPLSMQKFNGSRATDGRIIIPTDFSTLVLRLNASGGSGSDEWAVKNVKAHIQAIDETAPTMQVVSVAPGYHAKGNTVYVSVAFSEIVTTSSAKLTSSWGDLSYVAGSSTNVLTFSRTIPESASGALSITGYSGIADLAGNAPPSFTESNLSSLDTDYVYTISYDLDGGSVATENYANYTYETAAFTLNNPIKPGYSFDGWTGSNGSTPSTTVTIANHSHGNRTYTANWVPLWGQDDNADGSQAHPYIISSIDGLNMLAKVTNGTDGFTAYSSNGVFYRLDSNLDLGGNGFDGIGFSNGYYFNGTFDGNGKTISNFVINKPGVSRVGIFGNCTLGTVKNLIVDNAVVTGGEYVGIIVGTSYDGTFTNCLVFNSSITCDNDGGVIYGNLSSYMKVSGCHYANCTVNNTPASDMFLLTLGNGITASGETVVHGTDTYGVAGTTFTLSIADNVSAGYEVVYSVNGTPIAGNTFTMPEEDSNVSAAITAIPWAGSGTEADPWQIQYPSQLDLLAKMVNGTDGYTANDFNGQFFKLANDITYAHTTDWDDANSTENNYTPIGIVVNNIVNPFYGTFDGCGHVISGIRIFSSNNRTGLFGRIREGGTVKNLTLTDARISSSKSYVGGIVGDSDGTIQNCHVTSTVAIFAMGNGCDTYGGIVGRENWSETSAIIDCTSAATLDNKGYTGCDEYGGIVGTNNGTVQNCLAVGVSVPSVNSRYGAIIGWNSNTLTANYYRNCTVGATVNATNVGVGNGSGAPADQDGARSVHELALPTGVTATGESVEITSSTYFAAGTTVTLSYSNLPDGGSIMYQVNGTAIDGNSFTMPAQDVTITAQLSSTVSYIDADGTEKSATAMPITESQTEYGTVGETNWYVVSGEVNLSKLSFRDDETLLILEDGARLTIYYNEQLTNGALEAAGNITIYGQSNGTGQLIAESAPSGYSVGIQTKTIIINSGNIIVTAMKYGIYTSDSSITINGGSVTATGFDANGSGLYSNSGITINGGNVNSIGTDGGNGIFAGGSIVINGGSVKTSVSRGIYGRNITITDGDVEAGGTSYGIYANGGNITIDGGNVEAISISTGGIGRGIYAQASGGSGGKITISGGIVEANGGYCGIYGSPIQLAGGTVTASKYYGGTVSIKSGLKYTDGTTTYTGSLNPDQRTAIAGKTMTPYVAPSPNLTLVQGTKDGVTAYWGTFYDSGSGYTLPAGAAAYTMDADYHLYRLGTDGSVIPKATAVVIMADQATISLTTSNDAQATDNAPGGNILVGRDVATVIDGIYVLGVNASGAVGFYPLSGIALPAHKAGYVPKVGGLHIVISNEERTWTLTPSSNP